MEYLDELKEMLCEELEKVVQQGELTAGSLDMVQKLTHSLKSIETIMAMEGYSNDDYYANTSRKSYNRKGSYNGNYARGYARRGSYRRGRSRDDEAMKMVEKLERMAEQTEDPASKQAIQQAIESLDM
jgi:hypothetical protein